MAHEPVEAKQQTRITLWLPEPLVEELDRVNAGITAASGLSVTRATAFRAALLVYAKTALDVTRGRRLWSASDLEGAFLDKLQQGGATAMTSEAQRLLRQITELQQELTSLMGGGLQQGS